MRLRWGLCGAGIWGATRARAAGSDARLISHPRKPPRVEVAGHQALAARSRARSAATGPAAWPLIPGEALPPGQLELLGPGQQGTVADLAHVRVQEIDCGGGSVGEIQLLGLLGRVERGLRVARDRGGGIVVRGRGGHGHVAFGSGVGWSVRPH